MKTTTCSIALAAALFATWPAIGLAQEDGAGSEALKMAAIEALMVAPPERALPVVRKLLAGDHSDEIKSRALFILGQIHLPEAREALLEFAMNADGELQREAVRTIGISGDRELTAQLGNIYESGDEEIRQSVLQAYMIAGDAESVYAIASGAENDQEFDEAVRMLGAMGATEQLSKLRDRPGATESLIQAFAIAGDTESLLLMARDDSDRERQLAALRGLGIAGGEDVSGAFYDIYRNSDDREIREAVRHGMMVAGDDDSVLRLFREATNDREKAELLRLLVIMDSDAAMDAIDEALGGDSQ